MVYLILSVVFSTGLFAVFKLFNTWKIDNFQAVTVNYWFAGAGAYVLSPSGGSSISPTSEPWALAALILGLLFISNFLIMARTSQIDGVSVTSIAVKLSMIIPALYFLIFDPDEAFTLWKIIGITLGIAAIILTSARGSREKMRWKSALPLILFIGSGCIDLLLAYAEKHLIDGPESFAAFVPVPFFVAATVGTIILIVRLILGKTRILLQNIAGGVLLGSINLGAIWFFLKLLGSGFLDRSAAIPVNSLATIVFSALVGLMIFGERLSAKDKTGLLLALAAILSLIPFV